MITHVIIFVFDLIKNTLIMVYYLQMVYYLTHCHSISDKSYFILTNFVLTPFIFKQ